MRELKIGILVCLFGALAVATFLGWRVYQRLDSLHHNTAQMAADHQLLTSLEAVLRHVAAAQAGQRDFILTGDAAYLEGCQSSLLAVGHEMQAMRKLDSVSALAEKFREMDPLLVAQVGFFNRSFSLLRLKGRSAAAAALSKDTAADSLERINRLAASMMDAEALQLQRQAEAVAADERELSGALGLGSAVLFLLFLAVPLLMRREIARRTLAEAELARASAELKDGLLRLERHTLEIDQLSTFAEAVQACQDTTEFHRVVGPLVAAIFGDLSGCVALLNPGKNLLTEVACFGSACLVPAAFSPQDCWAIRRGQPYLVSPERKVPACAHLGEPAHTGSFCLPLTARSELMGLFFLVSETKGGLDESHQKLAIVVAEQMSLALANLRLLERLKGQSTVDPLTGLFNRRHMEECFDLIKAKCSGKNGHLAVVMVDIDHFKGFNDAHGHDAGDHVLKEVSRILQGHMRQEDVLCRYGGEEMVMLFPGLTMELAVARAEQCRKSVEAFQLSYHSKDIGHLTVSLGVAGYPEEGETFEQLVKAADLALYRAKSGGRNQVVGARV